MVTEVSWEAVMSVYRLAKEDLEEFDNFGRAFILDFATKMVPENRYTNLTYEARLYFACHMAAMHDGPAAGEGTQNGIGIDSFSSSVTLAVNNPKAADGYNSTVFGRQYMKLLNAKFDGFYVG